MGVQTMSSPGGGGGGGGGGAGVLSRQGSVYGLTLNEVESHLGEPLRSMNLEDLLRTVLPAAAGPEPNAPGTGKKTVDEVWRDIESAGRGRQPTVGEMTLEDFLSRAGVPVDGAGACGAGASAHWLHQYHPPQQYVTRPLPRPLGVSAGPVLDTVYHDGGVGVFFSQVGGGRKRGAALVAGEEDGVVEKTVERRQKRMIKNRESAARSRARKQAYTNELENKVAFLEEQIKHLKDLKKVEPIVQFMPQPEQQPGTEEQHQQLLRQVVLFMPRPEPEPEPNQHHIRRINSASF